MVPATDAPVKQKKQQIRPPVAAALQLIVHEGLSITDAARRVGMQRESLSKALKKPHIVARLADVKRAWLESETFKAWNTVAFLADGAASEDVRLKAARTILEARGELSDPTRKAPPTAAFAVQIITSPASVQAVPSSASGVFEIPPLQVQDQGDR